MAEQNRSISITYPAKIIYGDQDSESKEENTHIGAASGYSIPPQLNPGEVAGAPQFPILGHSIPGQFIPGQAAGAATGTSGGPVRRRKCSSCREPYHHVETCPHLPCKYCAKMGHLGRNCPTIVNNRTRVATCSICKEPGHQRYECPSRPCRYCRACGILAAKRAERMRKADAWRQA